MQVSIAVQEILFLLILILFILGLTYFFYKFFSKKSLDKGHKKTGFITNTSLGEEEPV